jgi:hypothetical protein
MTFNIVAMICMAGMSPADCGPEPGFSRDVAIIGSVSNELWCGVEAQQDLAKSAVPQPRGRRVHQNHVRQKRLMMKCKAFVNAPTYRRV